MNLSTNHVTSSGAAAGPTKRAGGRSMGSLGRYMAPRPENDLVKGQIIKGEVTDLKNNEVTVTLEDETKITGKLKDSSSLSIGDTAAFVVEENNDGDVSLKALPKSESLVQNSTISKALEEAGLPKNERNQAVVRELMNHQMPISKQSIQALLKLYYANKNINIGTLAAMSRLDLPITEQNAAQFEHYSNHEHRLVKEIDSMADRLPELLTNLSSKDSPLSVRHFGQRLLNAVLDDKSQILPQKTEETLLLFPGSKEAAQLVDILETFPLSDQLRSQILSGTAPLRQVADTIQAGMELAMELDSQALLEESPDSLTPSAAFPPEGEDLPKVKDLFRHPVIDWVLNAYADLQTEHNELASFLPVSDREALLARLSEFPLDPAIREKIATGTATAKEVLICIKNALPNASTQEAEELFRSAEFKVLLRESIINNWTLTPRTLTKEQSVSTLYDKLYHQLNEIDTLLHSIAAPDQAVSDISNQAGQMKDNINFMKMINEMYTYVQLPVKLKDQAAHGELYVYTKKKSLQNDPGNIRILLHLDMDYLGPLDIHLALKENQISAKFYLETRDVLDLIEQNKKQLSDVLLEKGFITKTEFHQREKEVDFVTDFLEKDIPASPLSRYTFDIRA